ncbi:MAG: ribonuclease J, partial [Clostridia bacterium]
MAKIIDKTILEQIDEQIEVFNQKSPKPIKKVSDAAAVPVPLPNQAKPEKRQKHPQPQNNQKEEKRKLRIIPLGGVDGIGKNITVFEFDNDIIIVDCGLAFPEDNMLGVDLVIPDTTYLEQNCEKIRGLFLTHGHEDHIGAVPYFLKKINVPIYGTRLTLGILEGKLEEHGLLETAKLNVVSAGDIITKGNFSVEFIRVTHSIPDSSAFCIKTPVGAVICTGDFKIDLTPVQGECIDLGRFAQLGNEGVRLLMCDSTNVERAGYTPTEKTLYTSFDRIFSNCDKRILVATFSSNVHRVQQIINTSAKHDRKVVVTGRSMLNVLRAATKLGYINIPEGLLIELSEMKRYKPSQITVITTGSQGEPMSALYRMAFGEHNQVSVGTNDVVVLSSSPIPGNEKLI